MAYDSKATENQSITARDVWQKSLETFRATKRQTVHISALGFFAPYISFVLFFDLLGIKAVKDLELLLSTGVLSSGGFTAILSGPLEFLNRYAMLSALLFLVFLSTYLGLMHIVISQLRSEPPLRPTRAFIRGLRTAIPRGLFAVVLFLPIMLFGEILVVPALIASVLGLIIPVVMVAEKKGALRAFGDALSLRYARQSRMNGWNVFFTLATFGASFYLLSMALGIVCDFLLHLDEWMGFPRGVWAMTMGESPITGPYLFVTILHGLGLTGLVSLLPAITASLYFMVVGRRDLGKA